MSESFPKPIKNLPRADIPIEGLKAYLSQSDNHQIIFMEFTEDVDIPEHSHGSQYGIVLEGNIDITIAGIKESYSKGDTYFIPAGRKHSSRIYAGYKDVTYFDEADRYKVKK